jgi:hypothetical protein
VTSDKQTSAIVTLVFQSRLDRWWMGHRNVDSCERESLVDTNGVGVGVCGQDGVEDGSGYEPTNTHRVGARCLLGFVNVKEAWATVILALEISVAGDGGAKLQGGCREVALSNANLGREGRKSPSNDNSYA